MIQKTNETVNRTKNLIYFFYSGMFHYCSPVKRILKRMNEKNNTRNFCLSLNLAHSGMGMKSSGCNRLIKRFSFFIHPCRKGSGNRTRCDEIIDIQHSGRFWMAVAHCGFHFSHFDDIEFQLVALPYCFTLKWILCHFIHSFVSCSFLPFYLRKVFVN